jgi:hypothetical protein
MPILSCEFQEPEAKPLPTWPQSAVGLGMGLPPQFGGGGMFQPPPFPPSGLGVVSNGANNPNVIVVDTNQLTTRYTHYSSFRLVGGRVLTSARSSGTCMTCRP